ncbi:MAG TPA: hypothetical protein VN457_02155, partial [Chlamydiales bacterium]|nr:hypothetical protein [Chlamydiales bacterium]
TFEIAITRANHHIPWFIKQLELLPAPSDLLEKRVREHILEEFKALLRQQPSVAKQENTLQILLEELHRISSLIFHLKVQLARQKMNRSAMAASILLETAEYENMLQEMFHEVISARLKNGLAVAWSPALRQIRAEIQKMEAIDETKEAFTQRLQKIFSLSQSVKELQEKKESIQQLQKELFSELDKLDAAAKEAAYKAPLYYFSGLIRFFS